MVKKFDVTIIETEPQNIYNSTGVALVGPLATVEHVGEKVTFMDSKGAKVTIVQPKSNLYELHPAEKAVYIVDRGQVWVQPADYPLPPEFNAAPASLPAPQSEPSPSSTPQAKPLDVSASNPTPTQPKNATEKLRELNALFKEGLINKTEYEARKRAILDAM